MRRNCARMLLTFISTAISAAIWAQPCTYYPADCPGDMLSKNQTFCDHHFILSEEIKMQDKIRDFITGQMEEIADAKNGNLESMNTFQTDMSASGGSQ